MEKIMMMKFNSPEWSRVDNDSVSSYFIMLGFKTVGDVMAIRVFDLLNLNRINNNRAEEMLLCIYRLLHPNRKLDEGIYNEEIDQYFSYREWKKKHKQLKDVTVSDILLTEGINRAALLRIFDRVTSAFYKSSEYDSRTYLFDNLAELLKYRSSGGKEDNNG